MKKALSITLAAGLASALPLQAANSIFLTGSTAFRANVHDACFKLFSPAPAVKYDTTKVIGGDGTSTNSNPVWTMTGTPISAVTNISGTMTIYADFTGSIQGIAAVENKTKLPYLNTDGTLRTNTPTIAFTDNSSGAVPYPAKGSFSEEQVAVQPFVIVKSNAGGVMNSINNVTWEQLNNMVTLGSIPLSTWTGNKAADYNTSIYLLQRTKDSGTRRTILAYLGYGYNQGVSVYNFDPTNNAIYSAVNSLNTAAGAPGYGVVGSAGVSGANLNWGPGYVGGGDIKNAIKNTGSANLTLGYLSFADAKGITGVNWSQVISLNGVWPTAASAALHGNTGTNDFSPISAGCYGYWGYEVVVYPNVAPSSLSADQDLVAGQLGNRTTPGTFLGVLDAQTYDGVLATPAIGSLENEIENSKVNGATAIRLSDMTSSRTSVGGTITP